MRGLTGVLLLSLAYPIPARAQIGFDLVGARALGMAGAFVAVADDATGGFWNPAGLVGGPPAGLTIGSDRFQFRDLQAPPSPGASRISTNAVAVGTWPLGLSFLHTRAAAIRADSGGVLGAEALRTSQIGVTVLHSLAERFIVGATVKYVRGSAAIAAASSDSSQAALDAVLGARTDSHGALDVDIGFMAGSDRFRAGLALKNLRRPGFATLGGKAIYLERRARFGLSTLPADGLTLAIDVDLDTADPLVGLRQSIAIGGEKRLGARLALRGGIRWQRSDRMRPIGAVGGSVRVRQGLWLDGYFARSQSRGGQGFGVALRAGA